MTSLINKARKPKFEVHFKIYDLNNVPLVSGTSLIKWHLSHSIHAEHRGRTPKCPISNHRVDYHYSKVINSIRIGIDKNNNLTECPIEFEVLQEFSMVAGGMGARDEKISLGIVRLNLSEYVEESEGLTRDSTSFDKGHFRKRSTGLGTSPTTVLPTGIGEEQDVEEGIVRRYLMQESKINSTLKIGILMVQLDGDRNYVAPPLKTAPVFGGIAGIMAGEQVEQDDAGQLPTIAKTRDASEIQDMYRRALAASWSCQPGELPADQCIEDIFSGGDGWKSTLVSRKPRPKNVDVSGSPSSDEGLGGGGTLRPSDIRRMHLHGSHRRHNSGASDKSITTVTGRNSPGNRPGHGRHASRDDLHHHGGQGGSRSRSESLTSLAPTIGSSDRGRDAGFKRAREVDEFEVRDDMVAWRLPGTVT